MDKAHIETDRRLEKIERDISAIYTGARYKIRVCTANFYKRFEKADTKLRKRYETGDITRQQYKTWRKRNILGDRRFARFKREISLILFNANIEALGYISEQLPDIYVLNYNATKERHGLADFDTIERLPTKTEESLPHKIIDKRKDMAWNAEHIEAAIYHAAVRLLPLVELREALDAVVEMNKNGANRNAVVLVTGAENLGRYNAYEKIIQLGYHAEKRWKTVGDDRVRHAHRELADVQIPLRAPFYNRFGEIRFPGDPYADPRNTYGCRCHLEIVLL